MDGLTHAQDIADIFCDKCYSITARHTPQRIRVEAAQSRWYTNILSLEEVERSLKSLNEGIGFDGLHNNLLKFHNISKLNYIEMC